MRRIERDPEPWYGNDDIRCAHVAHEDDPKPIPGTGLIRALMVGALIWIIGLAAIIALRGK